MIEVNTTIQRIQDNFLHSHATMNPVSLLNKDMNMIVRKLFSHIIEFGGTPVDLNKVQKDENDIRYSLLLKIQESISWLTEVLEYLKDCLREVYKLSRFVSSAEHTLEWRSLKKYPLVADLIYFFLGDVLYLHNDNSLAIFIFRQVKNNTERTKSKDNLLKAYYRIAKAAERMGQYKLAITYAKRSLEISFLVKDSKHELKLYDFIGKQYFYLNDIPKAKYFHLRMINKDLEPEESGFREFFLHKFQRRQKKEEIKALQAQIVIQKGNNSLDIRNNRSSILVANELALLNKVDRIANIANDYGNISSSEEYDIPVPKTIKVSEDITSDEYKEKFKDMPGYYRLVKKNIFKRKQENINSKNVRFQDSSLPKISRKIYKDRIASGSIHPERYIQHLSGNRESDVYFFQSKPSLVLFKNYQSRSKLKSKPYGTKKRKIDKKSKKIEAQINSLLELLKVFEYEISASLPSNSKAKVPGRLLLRKKTLIQRKMSKINFKE